MGSGHMGLGLRREVWEIDVGPQDFKAWERRRASRRDVLQGKGAWDRTLRNTSISESNRPSQRWDILESEREVASKADETQKVKQSYHLTQQFHSQVPTQRTESTCLHGNSYVDVHNSIIHNNQRETTQMSKTECVLSIQWCIIQA